MFGFYKLDLQTVNFFPLEIIAVYGIVLILRSLLRTHKPYLQAQLCSLSHNYHDALKQAFSHTPVALCSVSRALFWIRLAFHFLRLFRKVWKLLVKLLWTTNMGKAVWTMDINRILYQKTAQFEILGNQPCIEVCKQNTAFSYSLNSAMM